MLKELFALTRNDVGLWGLTLKMEGAVNTSSAIQQEGGIPTGTPDAPNKVLEGSGVQRSPWTVRKIFMLASLFLVYFVVFAAYSIYAPFFPSVARSKGVSDTVVGLIFGTYPFVVFVSSPFFGVLIPKYGPRFVLIPGMILIGGSLILFGFGGMLSDPLTFIVFCFLVRTTSAIGGAASETSALSIVIEKFPDNVGAVIGAVETLVGAGLSLGPALGGVLYTVGGFKLPFIVLGSAMIAIIPVVLVTLNDKETPGSENTEEQSTSIFKALRIPGVFMLGILLFAFAALCYVIIGSSFAYIEPIFGPHMKQLGETPTYTGLMFFLFFGVYALSAPGVGWIGDKTKCYRGMLILGFTGIGFSYLLLGPATFLPFLPDNKVWLVCIALPVCGLFTGFSFVTIMPDMLTTARMNGMPNNSSTYSVLSSIFGSMFYLGGTIGPSIAGIFDQHFGFQWSTSVAGFIAFGHAMLLSAFTLFERVFQRNKGNYKLLDQEEE